MSQNTGQQHEVDKKIDQPRRRFLVRANTAMAVVGAAAVSVPFIKSWMPSERAKAGGAPIQFDLSKLEPGRQVVLKWRGKPIFVLRRTAEILRSLNQASHLQQLRDPDSAVESQQPLYATNQVRSIREEYFIAIGICTHLGCIPTFRPDVAPEDLGPLWVGGYFCPCHSSKFDLAGRVFKGVPAPTNLLVPPYKYLSDSLIRIGMDPVA